MQHQQILFSFCVCFQLFTCSNYSGVLTSFGFVYKNNHMKEQRFPFSLAPPPFTLRTLLCFFPILASSLSHLVQVAIAHCPGKAPIFPFQLVLKLPIYLRKLGCLLSCGNWVQSQKPLAYPRFPVLRAFPFPLQGGESIGAFSSCGEAGPVQPSSTWPPWLLQLQMNRPVTPTDKSFWFPLRLPCISS